MPFGQTCVEYNGVHITRCVTEQFDEEAVYDQGGSQLLYHRFTITVAGYCTGDDRTSYTPQNPAQPDSFYGGGVSVSTDTPDPTDQVVWIRSHLLKPRHRFTMRTGTGPSPAANGGTFMLEVDPYPTSIGASGEWPLASPTVANGGPGDERGYDLNNGPKCLGVSVTRIVGNNLLFVRATFEITKLECETGDGRAATVTKGVLSNRWTMEDGIDANQMTIRTIHGRLRVTTPHIEANAFRGWAIPTLQDGFRRESMKFVVTEDGLSLDYTITDKEVAFSCPPPATSWRFKYTESVLNGSMSLADVVVWLQGNRSTPKSELMKTAAAIAHAKTKFLAVPKPQNFVIKDVTCIDEYGDSENSITLRVQIARPKEDAEMAGVKVSSLGKPIEAADFAVVAGNPAGALQPLAIGYDRNKSTAFLTAGHIDTDGMLPVVNAFRDYLHQSCGDFHKIESSIEQGNINYYAANQPSYTLSVAVVTTLPTTGTTTGYLKASEKDQPYTNWQCESLFHENKTRVHLPVAGAVSFSSGGGAGPLAIASAVVTLAQGIATRTIRFKGTRIGKAPDIPKAPDEIPLNQSLSGSTDPKATLLDARIRPVVPSRTVDGDTIYSVDGEFIYAIPVALLGASTGQFVNALFIGLNPWEPPPSPSMGNSRKYDTSQVLTSTDTP